MNVLFVDDDPVIRRVGQYVLENTDGVSVTMAADGPEALASVDQSPPDVIVLDYMMPGMNGDEVLAILQSSPATRSIPVVFLTGLDDGPQLDALHAAGAAGYIPKPFHPASLAGDLFAVLGLLDVAPSVQP
jgi:two-component system phosphate regulon response regulator PhoB